VKILFCTLAYFPGTTGGAERQARLQAEDLVRRGHEVTVVCARTDGLRSQTIGGVRVIRLRRIDRRRLFRISYLVRLAVWLAWHGRRYDVVHVHLANLQADIGVLAARLHGRCSYVKLACGGRVGEIQRFAPVARLTRWYGLRHADRVQVLSAEIEREVSAIGVPAERTVEIPNGIDLAEFHPVSAPERETVRAELGLPQHAVIVLFAGRLVDYKGIGDLLEAWPSVRLRETAELVVVGSGPMEPRRALDGVTLCGWAESPLRYLQAADVFVHPSHADGMSNAVLEAMACGCALVATEHGATHDLLVDEHDALLVPVRSPTALAQALQRLVADRDLRNRLAANARQSVARFAIARVVDQIEAEYRALLSRRPKQPARLRPGRPSADISTSPPRNSPTEWSVK